MSIAQRGELVMDSEKVMLNNFYSISSVTFLLKLEKTDMTASKIATNSSPRFFFSPLVLTIRVFVWLGFFPFFI